MKKIFTILFSFILFSNLVADWGMFNADRSYIGINFGGSATTYKIYDNGTVSGSGFFNGANLGTLTSIGQTISITFWDIKTYKNSGSDVTGSNLYYRLYEQGQTPGNFVQVNGGFLADLGNGDQKWGKSSSTSIDVAGLLAGKTYMIEIYIEVFGNPEHGGVLYDNNGNANYIATFTTDPALPVELTTFTALAKEKEVELNWETATEVNNYGFEVERQILKQVQNDNWEKVGFVEGHGNSNSPKLYSYTDNLVIVGKYQYRLKQIDIDGSYEYSDVVEVNLEVPNKLELVQNYPNPFNPATSIQFSLPEASNVSLSVYNIIGEQVAEVINQKMDAGYHNLKFDGSKFNSGVYVYRLQTEKATLTRKMLLMK